MAQLAVNLTAIVLAGVVTLSIQRRLFERRRRRHMDDDSRAIAGLPSRPHAERAAPMIRQLAIMLAAFVLGTAVAAALGAVSFGVALGRRSGLLRRDAGLGPPALIGALVAYSAT